MVRRPHPRKVEHPQKWHAHCFPDNTKVRRRRRRFFFWSSFIIKSTKQNFRLNLQVVWMFGSEMMMNMRMTFFIGNVPSSDLPTLCCTSSPIEINTRSITRTITHTKQWRRNFYRTIRLSVRFPEFSTQNEIYVGDMASERISRRSSLYFNSSSTRNGCVQRRGDCRREMASNLKRRSCVALCHVHVGRSKSKFTRKYRCCSYVS